MRQTCPVIVAAVLCVVVIGCQTDSSGGVVDKMLQDFGLQERPEGYESGSDKVFTQLDEIARAEITRLNTESRRGEIKFEEADDLFGKFYKEVKVYEDFRPIDARPAGRGSNAVSTGYVGTIEYVYRVYQSPRVNTRAEAAAESTSIATEISGRDTLRYTFDRAGNYSGGEGARVN